MSNVEPETFIGSIERNASTWLVVAGIVLIGSFVVFERLDGFDEFPPVLFGALFVAALLALVQAYRNGNVLLSWLLATAPLMAMVLWWATVGGLMAKIAIAETPALLAIALFFGTTAHLLGIVVAETRGSASRATDRREWLGLLAVLVVTGAVFVAVLLWPLLNELFPL